MKKILLLLLIITCSSCAKDHGKTAADLDFLSIERINDLNLYTIHYSSNINVMDLYGRGIGEGVASTKLLCALDNDNDFSVEHTLERSAYGLIYQDSPQTTGKKFNFLTKAFLSETLNLGQSRRDLSISELNRLLSNRETIPCKVVITAYGFKPYYSNSMLLPTADLLREINKPMVQ